MKDTFKNESTLDDFGGMLTDYLDHVNHDVRAIDRYCKLNNISPESLTEEQLKQFELN